MGIVQALVCSFVVISTFRLSSTIGTYTVEEGKPVTLKCINSVSKIRDTLFNWYKERLANLISDNRIAFYDNVDGLQNSFGDFANRATVDGTTGALTILYTKVSDDHFYTCFFLYTATGDIRNETQLIITVTPSQQDLKITTSPTGPVNEGETVSFKCSASRVKPSPRQMYWHFTDEANPINGIYINDTNADNLTSSVSVNYTRVVNRKDNGRKLICHYVSETRKDIQSEEVTVTVLYKPSGQPQIIPRDKKVKVNSAVSLTCDTEQIDGFITWYKWQFVNGSELVKTTEKIWTYRTRGNTETLQFVCIAGNNAGQSSASGPIEVKIQRFESDTNIPLILGIIIGAMTFSNIGMAMYIIHNKLKTNKLKTQNNERASEDSKEVYGKPNEDYEYMDPPDHPHGNQLPPDYINMPAEMPYENLQK